MYPEGTRSLSAQMASTLHSVHGAINVFEMAAGQAWRLVLDSWGLAGIGLFAAVAVIARTRFRADLRIMAALSVAVTVVTAVTAPAALPSDQSQTWASGRYLDGLIVTFFLVGAVVLLRARPRFILICAGSTAALTVLTAVIVSVYAGSSLPTASFPTGFNFGEPAVLAQNWTSASVLVSTAVALGLLAVWVAVALAARRASGAALGVPVSRLLRGLAVAGLAAVSLVAVTQMTSHVSRAATPAQAQSTTGFVAATGLKPGDQIAVAFTIGSNNLPATDVPYFLWAPQAFEVSWTELEFFNPAQAAAGRGERGRDRLADREGRIGGLAGPPGRVADRGLQSGRGLGLLAEILTWRPPVTHMSAGLPARLAVRGAPPGSHRCGSRGRGPRAGAGRGAAPVGPAAGRGVAGAGRAARLAEPRADGAAGHPG